MFRKDDVMIFIPRNLRSTPQAAEIIGISNSQLLVWFQMGKMQSISGPGIDNADHYLFSRPDIQKLAQDTNRN